MTPSLPYDLLIGLDRSDAKVDLAYLEPHTGRRWSQSLDTAPETLHTWLAELRQHFPHARVALCLEQPATNLILFLEPYLWITLYPINPITLQKFREAFVTSRAKDDSRDAACLVDLLHTHPDKLKTWRPDDPHTRRLQQLVLHRRAVVNERTALTNRLQALLKHYFPQALCLCGDELWRPLATAFLLKWPTLQAVQKTRPQTLRRFYYLHGSRSPSLLHKRLDLIQRAIPLTDETALLDTFALRVQLIARQLDLVRRTIATYDQQLDTVFLAHPDAPSSTACPAPDRSSAPASWPPWVPITIATTTPTNSSVSPASPRSPNRAGASNPSTAATAAPSSSARASTNTPRKACSIAAGPPPTTSSSANNAAPRITPPCAPWPTIGNASSSVAGRTAPPTATKSMKPRYAAVTAPSSPCWTVSNSAEIPAKNPHKKSPQNR